VREFLREAWTYALALVIYGLSFALMLFGAIMAWLAVKDVAAGKEIVVNPTIAVVGLLMVGVGVLVGRVTRRSARGTCTLHEWTDVDSMALRWWSSVAARASGWPARKPRATPVLRS